MPVMQCSRNGESGWKWGDAGHCYLPSEEGSEGKAKQKAYLQGVAVEGGEIPKNMAELLEVPLLTEGIHNGFPVTDLTKIIEDTKQAMPYLVEGIQTGTYRGQRDALNAEPIPGFINLNHDGIAPGKLKSWSDGVRMDLDTRLINGQRWVVGNFKNVDPELAQLLSVGFPGRSVEILPDFKNPETGETYPIVLRSVAFLDPKTKPAVPQSMGYSVKLSHHPQSDVLTVRVDVPNINNEQEENDMEEKAQEVVKLAQEDIIKLKARIDAFENENKVLRDAVTTMKQEKDELAKDVQTYRQQAHQAGVEKFCSVLEHEYNVTPAGIDLFKPVLDARNGIVKMAEAEIPEREAAINTFLEIVKLAKKNALFLPDATSLLPSGKQQEEKLTKEQRREKAIQKFMDEKKINYGDAYSQAARDPQFVELFDPLKAFEREEGK
jgi:hypothetical protein